MFADNVIGPTEGHGFKLERAVSLFLSALSAYTSLVIFKIHYV